MFQFNKDMKTLSTISPKILHVGTRVMVFSGKNQITRRDLAMADVAIFVGEKTFKIIKDRFKEVTFENHPIESLGRALSEYYQLIRLMLHDNAPVAKD